MSLTTYPKYKDSGVEWMISRTRGHFKKRNATYSKANSVHLSLS
jgi:hypothetical protein